MNGKLRNMTALYILRGEKILLLYRQGSRIVNNLYVGAAGGHFEKDELNDAKACVLRELQEECGLDETDLKNLSLRYVTLRLLDGEIRQNYYFFAELKDEIDEELCSNEGLLKWFEIDEISSLQMPFSAKYMTEHFLTIGRYNDKVYMGTANDEGVVFSELTE